MAHKKAGGSTKNGRESESKRLGIKKFGGEHVLAGNILVRQRGTVYRAGDNVGTGTDLTIKELVALMRDIVGYEGTVEWDHTRPDGTPRKLLDVSKQRSLGWEPRIELRAGIAAVYEWYQSQMVTASA